MRSCRLNLRRRRALLASALVTCALRSDSSASWVAVVNDVSVLSVPPAEVIVRSPPLAERAEESFVLQPLGLEQRRRRGIASSWCATGASSSSPANRLARHDRRCSSDASTGNEEWSAVHPDKHAGQLAGQTSQRNGFRHANHPAAMH